MAEAHRVAVRLMPSAQFIAQIDRLVAATARLEALAAAAVVPPANEIARMVEVAAPAAAAPAGHTNPAVSVPQDVGPEVGTASGVSSLNCAGGSDAPGGFLEVAGLGAPRTVWTDERRSLLVRMMADGASDKAILAALNALPGKPVSSVAAVRCTYHAMRMESGGVLPARTRRTVFTAERLALLVRLSDEGVVSVREITARLNALPGPPVVSAKSVGVTLSCRLAQLAAAEAVPVGPRAVPAAGAPYSLLKGAPLAVPQPAPQPHAERRLGEVSYSPARDQLAREAAAVGVAAVAWSDVRRWALYERLEMDRSDADLLRAVNARRAEYKIPPFTIIAPLHDDGALLPPPTVGG